MMKVTVDTNVLPIDELRLALEPRGFEFVPVTVSERELVNTTFGRALAELRASPEVAVWGESVWGHAKWSGDSNRNVFEKALEIIAHGSFPRPGQRANLAPGQRRQLRDAIIVVTHVRNGHDVFLTNDRKAFVDDGRRERFREELGTTVMTLDEFRKEFL